MADLLILGAGGFGQLLRETALELRQWERIAFLDDAIKREGVLGKCVDYLDYKDEFDYAYPAFGDNHLRIEWLDKLRRAGFTVPTLLHPSAIISPSVIVGSGAAVLHRAVIATGASIGEGCLVNIGAILDHDVRLEKGAHIGLGALVESRCVVPACHKLDAGTVMKSPRPQIDGVSDEHLANALYAFFDYNEKVAFVKPFGAGHINETYAVYQGPEGGEEIRYILQRLNTAVFHQPEEVMQNIFGVTEFLRRHIRAQGGDPDRETLNYLKTKTGARCYWDSEGQPWRCYHFIENSFCYQSATTPQLFYNSAKAFGRFLCQLGDYPADTLHETIPHFHDTPSRLHDLERAISRDILDRAKDASFEIAFIRDRAEECARLTGLLAKGALPLRVTHNDTKLNNVLFDETTREAICVIDLDTIMPGLALYDFGDSIRFGATTASEDEPDLTKVHFDLTLFGAYTRGYLETAGTVLTDTEKENLCWGAKIITLECGVRFLTDYLQGDTYFKTERPGQNLDRCRTQLKLVADMEAVWPQMQEIVARCR